MAVNIHFCFLASSVMMILSLSNKISPFLSLNVCFMQCHIMVVNGRNYMQLGIAGCIPVEPRCRCCGLRTLLSAPKPQLTYSFCYVPLFLLFVDKAARFLLISLVNFFIFFSSLLYNLFKLWSSKIYASKTSSLVNLST